MRNGPLGSGQDHHCDQGSEHARGILAARPEQGTEGQVRRGPRRRSQDRYQEGRGLGQAGAERPEVLGGRARASPAPSRGQDCRKQLAAYNQCRTSLTGLH